MEYLARAAMDARSSLVRCDAAAKMLFCSIRRDIGTSQRKEREREREREKAQLWPYAYVGRRPVLPCQMMDDV